MRELHSATWPGDQFARPLGLVLHRSPKRGEWVTHEEGRPLGDDWACYSGHYFWSENELEAYNHALDDFLTRCRRFGVDPLPELPPEHQNGSCRQQTRQNSLLEEERTAALAALMELYTVCEVFAQRDLVEGDAEALMEALARALTRAREVLNRKGGAQ